MSENQRSVQAQKVQSYHRTSAFTPVKRPETISVAAGAAGTVTNFYLRFKPILDSNLSDIGGDGNSSLALSGASVPFDNEVAFGTADDSMSNGDYYVNYLTGKCRGKKKTTATSMTATYSVPVKITNTFLNEAYDAPEFAVNTGTTDYNVDSSEADAFVNVTEARYVRIITDQTITIKFNATGNGGITVTSSESPFIIDFLRITNIFISNASGSTANIKIILA